MEEKILELRKQEIKEAALDFADAIWRNKEKIELMRGQVRFHYEYLMSRYDEYARALAQHKMNNAEKIVKPS